MGREVEVGPVGDAFQFAPRVAGKAELVFDVGGAVGEAELHVVAAIAHVGHALAHAQRARGNRVDQQRLEVAAVHGQIRGTPLVARTLTQHETTGQLARVEAPAGKGRRLRAHPHERVEHADAIEDAVHVGTQVDAGAKPRDRAALLEHRDAMARLAQERRHRTATQSRADHGDVLLPCHRWLLPFVPS